MLATILSCSVPEKLTDSNYHLIKTPPNGVRVADNFFCDKTEMTNIDWLEYMFWTKRIFGGNSPEYLATFPDTLVWRENYSCLASLTENYLKQPGYMYFPVVGVTQLQAINYSKWRSDRVFEKLLIDMDKIEVDSTQNKDSYFTIEKYFKGTFGKIIPGVKLTHYPNFRLPSLVERTIILQYADSVDHIYFKNCESKYCKDCKTNFPMFNSDVVPCLKDSLRIEPTISVNDNYAAKKGDPIFNLRGNVSEWSSEVNITLGGGWFDKRANILQADTFHTDKQNAWTGFRNVCEWKLWNE